MMETIKLNVNGEICEITVKPSWTLIDVLRDQLGLTGAKKGCGQGACGACTVIIDGDPALSCLTLAVRCRNRSVVTIEGLAPGGELHPLQKSAIDHGAVQCGFCTPGWLLSARALLDSSPSPTREEVREAIAGNFCRCTGYVKIEESILAAAGPAKEARVCPDTEKARGEQHAPEG